MGPSLPRGTCVGRAHNQTPPQERPTHFPLPSWDCGCGIPAPLPRRGENCSSQRAGTCPGSHSRPQLGPRLPARHCIQRRGPCRDLHPGGGRGGAVVRPPRGRSLQRTWAKIHATNGWAHYRTRHTAPSSNPLGHEEHTVRTLSPGHQPPAQASPPWTHPSSALHP